ncbi:MAG: leucine-rich repeat domain-containing protein [Bacilli bacterium]|nr:leucine-rich repeat domain-containing protein [Bacilli bacterium]
MNAFLKVSLLFTSFVLVSCSSGFGNSSISDSSEACTISYEEYGSGWMVSAVAGECDHLVIPQSYQGKSVLSIGPGAFRANAKVKNVTLPATVSSIDFDAFYLWETPIVKVDVVEDSPYFVYSAGALLSRNAEDLYFCTRDVNLTSFSLPTVKQIKGYAFWNNKFADTVVFHKDVNLVASCCFSGSHVRISFDGVSTNYVEEGGVLCSGDKVFWVNGSTKTVTIPAGKKISDTPFSLMNTYLTDIVIPEDDPFLFSVGGVVFSRFLGHNSLFFYPCGRTDSYYICPEETDGVFALSLSFNPWLEKLVIQRIRVTASPSATSYACDNFLGFFVTEPVTSRFTLGELGRPVFVYSETEPEPNQHDTWHYVNGEPVFW